jgi:Ca-activated chloride channel family protein
LKAACYILLLFLFNSSALAQQYYIRGEVKDEAGNPLQNVRILQNRTGYIFKTGSEGTFGIVSNANIDTLSFSFDGYFSEKLVVNADNYVRLKLKLLPSSITNVRRDHLASLTKDLAKDEQKTWFTGEET